MTRFWAELGVSLVALVAFGAALLARTSALLGAEEARDTVMVIVAGRELRPGVYIHEEDLYAVQMSPRSLPPGVFLSPEHLVGRIPHERILANELVRAERLASVRAGLNAVIPPGLRAISIIVSDAVLLDSLGFGSGVDVLVTVTARAGLETHTLLQGLTVLAARGSAVTLLVTAKQSEQLAHAEAMGRITLTMRNLVDMGGPASGALGELYEPQMLEPVRPRESSRRRGCCKELQIISGGEKKLILADELGVPCE